MRLASLLFLSLLLAGCSSSNGRSDGLITYTDAQGNLITVPSPQDSPKAGGEGSDEAGPAASDPGEVVSEEVLEDMGGVEPREATPSSGTESPRESEGQELADETTGKRPASPPRRAGPFGVVTPEFSQDEAGMSPGEMDDALLEQFRDSDEVSRELKQEREERERDRFVTWQEIDGTPVTMPFDAIEAREQRERERRAAIRPLEAGPGQGVPWVETATLVHSNCCLDVVESLPPLEAGQEHVFSFAERIGRAVIAGHEFRVVGVKLGPSVREIELLSYIRSGKYVHPHVLVLDREGRPVLAVNSLFTERHSQTWFRYGYLAGSLEREEEHAFLLLYLPYEKGMDTGLRAESDLSTVSTGEVVVRGRKRIRYTE